MVSYAALAYGTWKVVTSMPEDSTLQGLAKGVTSIASLILARLH
jgi:hypothetical protein